MPVHKPAPRYDAADIQILEGLEPVRLRPGMYTRTENPLHILQEAIDNAADEALGGFASFLEVELLDNGVVRVADDGRGIPVGIHPGKKIPAVEAIFTMLHSGGKFDKSAAGAYAFSGGLHGVGVSVTNALSHELQCRIRRDGREWEIGFEEGRVSQPLKKLGPSTEHGTELRIRPNPRYFDSIEIPVGELQTLLQSKAILLPGLQVTFIDSRQGAGIKKEWRYSDGLGDYLNELTGDMPRVGPVFVSSRYAAAEDTDFSEGEGAAWAFAWLESSGLGRSFVNLIPTPDHGTHVSGLKAALFEALKAFIEHHGLMPKGVKLTGEDVFKNVAFVLSARVLDPMFAGQTKDKMISRDALKLIESSVRPSIEGWLNQNPIEAKLVAELVIRQAMARQRASAKPERKKSSSVVMLPGKLTDCTSDTAQETELFLVEGDSAGGSAKQARDKNYQAILPMRGKGMNVWEKDQRQALENDEIHSISVAIGIPPHKEGDEVDWSRLRYHKICILADADVDGYHIQVLLLTLFLKHFPQLVDRGHVYVARPPLYRVDADAFGKTRKAQKLYAMDEQELSAIESRLRKDGYSALKVGRFKGLGEMNGVELWDTTLNPETRRLFQVCLPADLKDEARSVFDLLMSKAQAASRREWLEERGNEAAPA